MEPKPLSFEEISPQAMAYLATQTTDDETILWVGRTDVDTRRRRLIPLVVSCLFLLLLCVFVFTMNNSSPWGAISISALVCVGIPVFVVWQQTDHLRRTLYAITSRRALILSMGKPKRTESYPSDKIEFVKLTLKKSGRGDVLFTTLRGRRQSGYTTRVSYDHGFLDVVEPKQVADVMRRTFPNAPPKQ